MGFVCLPLSPHKPQGPLLCAILYTFPGVTTSLLLYKIPESLRLVGVALSKLQSSNRKVQLLLILSVFAEEEF